ncbi:MAG: MaoC/PaaZ C-terminal domain-containing protein [Pseudomonadota bacterium]
MTPPALEELRAQLGRVVEQQDVATAAPMRGMSVAFNRKDAMPVEGDAIPPGWHTAYFLPAIPAWELNADGTPLDNGVLPAMPFPRRMHTGLKVRFVSPIRVGDALRRENRFSGIEPREGRSGPLFVSTQTRSIFTPRGLAIEEEFTMAHLPAVEPGAAAPARQGEPAPQDATWERTVTPDAINLFRYSALTFNAHRIHYDRQWAMDVEGFRGLVVHGMFTAQCLLDLARDRLAATPITEFSFRAGAPLFEGEPIRLLGRHLPAQRRVDLWAVSPAGTIATKATVHHE